MGTRHRLYLETSFWKRLGDPGDSERRRLSYRFLRAVARKHRILISKLVIAELENTPDPCERRLIFRRMNGIRLRILTRSARMIEVRDGILRRGGWSLNRVEDMLHVAYSVIGQADALVTWDRHDIARERTREIVRTVCGEMGLKVPKIGFPEEVARWLDIRIQ